MFKKKNCKRCGNKITNKDRFCSNCGIPINGKNSEFNENFGMLGKNDFEPLNDINLPMGLNRIFNSLIKSLGKELNKEFSNLDEKQPQARDIKKSGVSIRISTTGNKPPEIKIDSLGGDKQFQKSMPVKRKLNIPMNTLSPRNQKRIAKLPKKEPLTNIKRLSNKVVYEIKIPGVKSINDVSIIQLENSIEIKALGKDIVYFKLIPINLPITNYNLSKGKLILELSERD